MGDLKLDLFPNLRRHVLMRVASTPEAIIQVLRCPVEEIKRGKGPPPDSDLFDVEKFTIYTRWRSAFGPRYYAIVLTADGLDLNELLVSNGLARIYGTRTPLPDGRDSREYLAHLYALENAAKAAKRGGWGMVTSASLRRAE